MPTTTRASRLLTQSHIDNATSPSGQQPGATSPQASQRRPRSIQGTLLGLRARGHASRDNIAHQPPSPPTMGYPVYPGQFQEPYHPAPQPYAYGVPGGASQWRAEDFRGFHTERVERERERQAGGAGPSTPQWRAEDFRGFHTEVERERERQAGGASPSTPQWRAEDFHGFHTNRGQRAAQGDGAQAGQRTATNDTRSSRPLTWYEMLGVNPHTMTLEQVKASYKREARLCHPDKGGDTAKFQALLEAYQRALAELQLRG